MQKSILAAAAVATAVCAQAPIQITAKDATMKLGVLAAPAYEATGAFNREGTNQNFFVRRMRLLLGGTVGSDLEYFVDWEAPNLGKANADGTKANSPMILQTAIFTYKVDKNFKIDAGFLLPALSHNGTQGAINQNTWDYGAYSFQQNGPMGSSVGRDAGVQVRGMVGPKEGNLEYRFGVFQGKRLGQTATGPVDPVTKQPTVLPTDKVASRNPMRIAGRAQWNFLEAENGLFHAGTYFGAKKIISVGAGLDRQDDYQAVALDAFLDLPVGSDVVSGQWNHVTWNGKTWLPTLKKQTTDFAEASYYFGATKLAPMVRYDSKKLDVPTVAEPDETRVGVGLAWWMRGHQNNLKAFYTRVTPKAPGTHTLKSYDQVNVQWQWMLW